MKLKVLFPAIVSVLIGILCGKTIFKQYNENIKDVVLETKPIYLLQQGVYSTVESMEENTSNISDYLYVKQDDKYYVYLGVTSNKETADKLKQNYTNVDIYVKENSTNNETLVKKIIENDNSINNTTDKQGMLSLSKKSLEIYEEMMKTAKDY